MKKIAHEQIIKYQKLWQVRQKYEKSSCFTKKLKKIDKNGAGIKIYIVLMKANFYYRLIKKFVVRI